MGWRRWRYFLPGTGRGRKQGIFPVLLGIGLALLLISGVNRLLRPPLVAMVESQIRNRVTRLAEEAVGKVLYEQGLAYTDLVKLETGRGGEITTLSTDTVHLNRLRSAVMGEIVAQVENMDEGVLGVPLGVLTGVDMLSSVGPKLPVRVLSVASATGSYRNDFTSAGINQTLHRIFLDVMITVKVLLPGGIVESEITVPVSVAETVIIGQVPQTYLNWSP